MANITNDIYGSNYKPAKPTIKRKFGKPVKDKNEFGDYVGDQMERKDKAENTMTNEQLHELQSKNK